MSASFGVIACVGGLGIAVARPALGVLAEQHSTPFAFGVWTGVGVVLVGLAVPGIRRMRPERLPAPDPTRDPVSPG
jgi:hypothetical protein